jgi:hypothetical protein
MLEILITGTGRCGTAFAAHLLESAGVYCTHEVVFNPMGWSAAQEQMRLMIERPEWNWTAESSWGGAVHLTRPELDSVTVVHLVRHPKKVLDSHLREWKARHPHYNPHYHWLTKHLPELADYDTPEGKAACKVLRLNEMIEARADVFHRIEDDPRDLLDKLSLDWQGCELFNNPEHNAHPGHAESDVQLADLPEVYRERIEKMSTRYGYEWT